jgi:hypothetical protein
VSRRQEWCYLLHCVEVAGLVGAPDPDQDRCAGPHQRVHVALSHASFAAAMQAGLDPKGDVQAIGQRLVDWLDATMKPVTPCMLKTARTTGTTIPAWRQAGMRAL